MAGVGGELVRQMVRERPKVVGKRDLPCGAKPVRTPRLTHSFLSAALLLVAASPSTWSADAAPPRAGAAAAGAIPDRIIRITDETRYVNVMRHETVRFVAGENSFDWRFDQFDRRVFPLANVAPNGVLANRSVLVYIQRDPPSD